MMRRARKDRAQSTVEYVIVFVAIAAAVVFAGVYMVRPAVNSVYNEAMGGIEKGGKYLGNTIGFGFHGVVND